MKICKNGRTDRRVIPERIKSAWRVFLFCIFRTASPKVSSGNSVIIQSIVFIFKFSPGIQRDKSLFKMETAASRICSESISGEQIFVNFYKVKGSIQKNPQTGQWQRGKAWSSKPLLECCRTENYQWIRLQNIQG